MGYAQLLIAARKNEGEYFESKTVTLNSTTTGAQEMMSHHTLKALTEQVAHLMAALETKGGNCQKWKGQKGKKNGPPSNGGNSNQSPSSSSGNNTNNSNGNSSSGETLNRPTTNRANSQCYRCKGFGHFARECLTPLNSQWGESDRISSPEQFRKLQLQQSTRSTAVNQWANHSNPRHTLIKDLKPQGKPEYHNPDPLVRLIEKQNIGEAEVDSITCDGLLDGGSQMTTITERCRLSLRLLLHPLENNFNIEGSRGTQVPHLGYE